MASFANATTSLATISTVCLALDRIMAPANAANVFANLDGRAPIVLAEIASILAFRHVRYSFN